MGISHRKLDRPAGGEMEDLIPVLWKAQVLVSSGQRPPLYQ